MTLPKKSPLTRDWPESDRICAACGKPSAELAHIIRREHDSKPSIAQIIEGDAYVTSPKARKLVVCRTRVIPLCGPATDSNTCHGKYDNGDLDILPYLTREQEIQAVADVGLHRAYRRVTGE